MNDAREPQDAGQHPHTPGQDPQGSGMPRDLDAGRTGPDDTTDSSPVVPESQRDVPESQRDGQDDQRNGQDDQRKGAEPQRDGQDDAPLGGDQSTEDRLEADTAVEEDALKSLDPDDTPA